MENSSVSLITGEDGPHHLQLPTTSHSFLCPSSALLHPSSESSLHIHHYPPDKYDKGQEDAKAVGKKRPFRSSLMEHLRSRFPDGRPPQPYDDFIQVSLNDVPPDSDLVMDPENRTIEEPIEVSPIQKLSRMTSRVFTTIINSVTSRPSPPLQTPQLPVISGPRPMEPAAGGRNRAALSPSPVQVYNRTFAGIGPPAPLPLPSDIRPSSRNTTNSHCSNSHSACSHAKQHVVHMPNPSAAAQPGQLSTKNSIVFPTVHEAKRKVVRIVTPRTNGASHALPSASPVLPQQKNRRHSEFVALLALFLIRLRTYLSRVVRFQDPAESLFLFGFFTGPQTWLLGGWYVTTTASEPSDNKSRLRIWVDKHVEQTDGVTSNRGMEHSDELLERIEQASSRLTSSSFEVGRRTVTDSNASRLRNDGGATPGPTNAMDLKTNQTMGFPGNMSTVILPTHFRSSRAVWSGPKTGNLERPEYGEDEISVEIKPSLWIYRCRIAAVISGTVVMSLFITALIIVCLR